ncbi:16S rRNA (uracil(1498)-N(3))-methyltransferase [bacterium]|nr:16S rRNA (uracil(1498)-N(3))-methyltransferase [bacterium]
MPPERRRIPIASESAGCNATLTGEWAHYLARVLRARTGEQVWAFCGDGHDYLYEVSSVLPSQVHLRFVERRQVRTDPTRELVLVVALPKAGKLEAMIEAATALGATCIFPFVSARSEGKPSAHQRARWNKAALEAARQCGRTTTPELAEPARSLAEAVAELHAALPAVRGAVGDPNAGQSLRAWSEAQPPGVALAWLVGPEGHLSPGELETAVAAGFEAVSLGPRILRAELAATAGLALLSRP